MITTTLDPQSKEKDNDFFSVIRDSIRTRLIFLPSDMSAVRKLFINTNLVRQQKNVRRALHLTAVEVNDKFVLKSDVGNVDIPHVTIPEVIEPKLDLYKNYTAVVSCK